MYLALNYIKSLISIPCIVLVGFAYVILYHETRRHRRKIKTQQLPQEEVERSTRENKALKMIEKKPTTKTSDRLSKAVSQFYDAKI